MSTGFTRRSFLTVCGGSALLAHWLRSAVARAQGAAAPKRLMVLHRPNGSIHEDWLRNGNRGPILEPFASVWPYTVALRGVNVRPSNNTTGGSHEAGLVTLMTGARLGPTDRTNDDFRSTAESLDQTLVKTSAVLSAARVPSVQVGAHGQQDGGNEVPNTTLSYSGPAQPLYPTLNPSDVYNRLFGQLMPGGNTNENTAELQRARARRRSVLDFVKWDLARVRKQFPASARGELEVQEGAIRELETALDDGGSTGGGAACAPPALDGGLRPGGDYKNTAKVGGQHLKIIAAAFACDITRVVTFMWATGASLLSFNDLGSNNHHATSHDDRRPILSAIDRWFSEQTVPFIQQLIDTADVAGGRLIDNTLVWYINEVSEGWSHSFNDYPFLLFGGDGVGLKNRGRVLDVSGQNKTSNDVWTSLAPVFGASLTSFPTAYSGPVNGLFV